MAMATLAHSICLFSSTTTSSPFCSFPPPPCLSKRSIIISAAASMSSSSSTPLLQFATSAPVTEILGSAVVVGGGPAGCLMAHYLLQRGFHVDLFEKYPAIAASSCVDGGVGIKGREEPGNPRFYPLIISTRVFKALAGADLQLPSSVLKLVVGNCANLPNGRKVRVDFPNGPNLESFCVSRNALVSFLQQSLLQRNYPNFSARFGWELSEISRDKRKAYFSTSKRHLQKPHNESTEEGEILDVEFDLLIGADGVSSKVRSELLRLDELHRKLNHNKTAPMTLEFTKHPATYKTFYVSPSSARQSSLFEDSNRIQSWPALNMLLVNIADGSFWGGSHNAQLVNAQSTSEIERLFRDNAPEVLELLLKDNQNFLEEFSNQPSMSNGGAVKLSRFHDDNIVLIGDAAHAMFPSYGTGCHAALEDCLLFNSILTELTPSDEGKYPVSVATNEFTKRRLVDAHAIVEMNSNRTLFGRGFLGFLQARFLGILQKWFPNLFGLTAYQLLFTDAPYSKVKAKKHLENKFFYATLAVSGAVAILISVLLFQRTFA